MALKDEISRETVKLRDMPFKKKVEYIWEYYKIPIIGVIAAIVFICVFIRDYRLNKRPVYLDAIVINSDIAYNEQDPLKNDYIRYAGVDTDAYNLSIDTGFLISENGTDQMTVANMQKIMALFAAGSVDVLLGPDSIMDSYGAQSAYMDINSVLPEDLIKQLSDAGYEIYNTTVYEENGEGVLQPVSTYAAGIYLDGSGYLNGLGAFDSIKSEGKRPVFAIASCAVNTDNAVKFLRMLTGLDS